MEITYGMLRIDEDGAKTRKDKLLKFLEKYERYYVYQEIASKTKKLHYHVAIEFKTLKEYNALKQRWCDNFREVQKGEKSCSKDLTGNYHIYITKGRDRIMASGFTDAELSEFESKSYEKPQESMSRSFTWYLLKSFNEENKGILIYDSRTEMYRKIIDWVLKKWREDEKIVQPFMDKTIVGIIYTIVLKNNDRIIIDDGSEKDVKTTIRDRLLLNFN